MQTGKSAFTLVFGRLYTQLCRAYLWKQTINIHKRIHSR